MLLKASSAFALPGLPPGVPPPKPTLLGEGFPPPPPPAIAGSVPAGENAVIAPPKVDK